jgi:hypothetical protein
MLEFHPRIPLTDIEHRKHPLPLELETCRLARRQLLRNGSDKPKERPGQAQPQRAQRCELA